MKHGWKWKECNQPSLPNQSHSETSMIAHQMSSEISLMKDISPMMLSQDASSPQQFLKRNHDNIPTGPLGTVNTMTVSSPEMSMIASQVESQRTSSNASFMIPSSEGDSTPPIYQWLQMIPDDYHHNNHDWYIVPNAMMGTGNGYVHILIHPESWQRIMPVTPDRDNTPYIISQLGSIFIQEWKYQKGITGTVYHSFMAPMTLPSNHKDPMPILIFQATLDFGASTDPSYSDDRTLNDLHPLAFSTINSKEDILTQGAMFKAHDKDEFIKAQEPKIRGLKGFDVFQYHAISELPVNTKLINLIWTYH